MTGLKPTLLELSDKKPCRGREWEQQLSGALMDAPGSIKAQSKADIGRLNGVNPLIESSDAYLRSDGRKSV
jgi:hypothetical protein